MLSLPKKNIKILIIGLMLHPTINNCSSYLPSDKTVMSKSVPTKALIAGVGVAAWICVAEKNMNILENDKLTLGLTLFSVAGGCAAYKYLSSFTPTSKLKTAENFLNKTKNKTEKALWLNVFEYEPLDHDQLYANINKKYHAEDYPNITFFKNDFQKLSSNTQQAKKVIDSTIKYLNKTAKKTESTTTGNNTEMQELLALQDIVNQHLEKLKTIASTIKCSDNFEDHLKEFNKKHHQQKKLPAIEEKTKILKSQNSYFNSLFSNPIFMQNFMNIAIALIAHLIGKFTGQPE